MSKKRARSAEGRAGPIGLGVSLVRGLDAVSPTRPISVLPAWEIPETAARAITLRPLCPEDRTDYVALINASMNELRQFLPAFSLGQSAESHFEDELERTIRSDEARSAWRRVIVHQQQLVGMASLINISRGLTLSADTSWWIGTPFTGRGLAKSALRLTVRHAFAPLSEGLGLHRLYATIAPENTASIRLALGLGFVRYPAEDHHLRMRHGWKRHQCYLAEVHTTTLPELKPGVPRTSELL